MCLSCWQPFEEEPAPAAAPAQPTAPVAGVPVAPRIPAQPMGSYAPVTITPSAAPGRRRAEKRAKTHTKALVAVVVAALVVGVGGGWLMFRHSSQSDEARFAEKFHQSTGLQLPAGVSAVPEVDAGPAGATITPGAFVASIDPIVRRANTDITNLQALLDEWAAGKAADGDISKGFVGFMDDLAPFTDLTERAPTELYAASKQLVTAANGYTIASGGILDWLDSRSDDSRTRYFTVVGSAAAAWKSGVNALYAGSGIAPPTLPFDKG